MDAGFPLYRRCRALDTLAQHLREHSVASSTIAEYSASMTKWTAWTSRRGIHPLMLGLPPQAKVQVICDFILHGFQHGFGSGKPVRGSTITITLLGIRHFFAATGADFPNAHPHVRMLFKGISRLDAPPQHKTPVSLQMLEVCFEALRFSDPFDCALWGVVTLAFFFIMRRSEIAAINGSSFKWFALRAEDLVILDVNERPTLNAAAAWSVHARLRGSKTYQGGTPTARMLYRSGHRFLCPVFGRMFDRFGNRFKPDYVKWRKLRTYKLVAGSVCAIRRFCAFNMALPGAISAAVESVRRQLTTTREEIAPETSQCEEEDKKHRNEENAIELKAAGTRWCPFSTGCMDPSALLTGADVVPMHSACHAPEEFGLSSPPTVGGDIIDLFSSDTDQEPTRPYGPILVSTTDASSQDTHTNVPEDVASLPVDSFVQYLAQIPTRYERGKIRHQRKKRPGEWLEKRSRKKRDLAKCSMTRSGVHIYHARTVQAKRINACLRLPGVKSRLKDLRNRRPVYTEPAVDEHFVIPAVQWPPEVECIEECKTNGVELPDLGAYDKCSCVGDCFMDSCENIASATYCTTSCCKLEAKCSNAPVARKTLKLFDTERVGLGVYTTTDLSVGDVVWEYTGELSELDGIVEGQLDKAVKQNSGYTLLYITKSVNKNYMDVDAIKCGSITHFNQPLLQSYVGIHRSTESF